MAENGPNEHKPDDTIGDPEPVQKPPVPVAEPTATNGVQAPTAAAGKRRWWLAVLLLLLGAAIGAGALWLVGQPQLESLGQRLEALERQPLAADFDDSALRRDLGAVQSSQRSQASALEALQAFDHHATEQNLSNLARQFAQLEQRIDTLGSASGQHWRLAEAEYLLRLAQQRRLLGNAGTEALALSEAVDAILRQQDAPALFAVRQALAAEIAALKQVALIDREGVYLQLQALIDQVGQLDLARTYEREATEVPADTTSASSAAGVWATVKASVQNALEVLSGYIRVRHHDQPIEPLLAPEQVYFLHQNLQLMLEQAQLAVLQAEPLVYQQSLDKAVRWLDTYFANSHSQALISEIEALQAISVQVDVPASGEALSLLRAYLAREQGGES